jgi:hypothetical protein
MILIIVELWNRSCCFLTLKNMCIIYPLTLSESVLIGRNLKFLLPLTNNKRPPGDDPSGHSFVD